MNREDLQKLNEYISEGNIVFFGGAGTSTESGIPDFRSQDGLYHLEYDLPPEQIISHSYYKANPAEFYRFYKAKMLYPSAEPNACHKALATLERQGLLNAVVTQNIDGLHQKAGSEKVYELHGSVWRNYCESCGKFYGLDEVLRQNGVPKCVCKGIIKPDIVLYEEGLDDKTVMGAVSEIAKANTLIVGGTSLVVYPAAGLLRYFTGKNLVVINKSPTYADRRASLVIAEPIGEVFDELMRLRK